MSSVVQPADKEQIQAKLKAMAEEISADLAQLESSQSKDLLSDFVSELFFNAATQHQKNLRCQRQAQAIAAARARGVRFGPAKRPLPDNFDECYEAWKNGQMTQTEAAKTCGISRTAFYREINRIKEEESCSV